MTQKTNNNINQLDLKHIHRILHPTTAEYIFFSSIRGPFSRTDHVIGHETRLNNLKRKSLKVCFGRLSGIKLEVNNKRKFGKFTDLYLNNTFLNFKMGQEKFVR